MSNSTYINIEAYDCLEKLTQSIKEQIQNTDKAYDEICIACIGTDRATGDCLGPLVGHKLSGIDGIKVRGTLDDTLMATNLKDFADSIKPNQLIIAVDACLGRMGKVGNIVIEKGSINPGEVFKKNLPPVGDINIKGIVNVGGFMDEMIICNTKLSLVMKMADAITYGLLTALGL